MQQVSLQSPRYEKSCQFPVRQCSNFVSGLFFFKNHVKCCICIFTSARDEKFNYLQFSLPGETTTKMAYSKKKVIRLLFFIIPLYFIFVVVASVSTSPNHRSVFPNTTFEVYQKIYALEVTPVTSTFSIWIVIYVYTFLWIIYTCSTVIRGGKSTEVLSGRFFIFFLLNIIFMIAYVFTWSRVKDILSFVMIVIAQMFLDSCFYFASVDIHTYLSNNAVTSTNKNDVRCLQFLVQNGILFHTSWTTVITLINTGVVFSYQLGTSTETASITILSFLTVILIAWYLLENFGFQTYTEYTFTSYIGFIWALSGIFAKAWKVNDLVGGFTLALLILTLILFIVRITIILIRNAKRTSYENISYNAKKQEITAQTSFKNTESI